MSERFVNVQVISGPSGPCLSISDEGGSGYRVAGPKPWGGGAVMCSFLVPADTLINAVKDYRFIPGEADG